MADGVITDVDYAPTIYLRDAETKADVLDLAGADEIKAGTILARDSVSLDLVLFVKGGATNENGIPKAVLLHAVSAAGAADFPVEVLVKGVVDKSKLVIDADGDDSNIDAAVMDQLRSYGITVLDVKQLGQFDNS